MLKALVVASAVFASSSIVEVSAPQRSRAFDFGEIPSGSYQQTCNSVRVDGYQLKAWCQRRDWSWQPTSLDLRVCDSDIRNKNGHLSCSGYGGHRGNFRQVPMGNYVQSCTHIRTRNGMLRAQCRTRSGSWIESSIGLDQCNRFSNNDGSLVCDDGFES